MSASSTSSATIEGLAHVSIVYSKPGSFLRWRTLSIEPVDRSSRMCTRSPCASNASARCDPMNPAPPVMRYRMAKSLLPLVVAPPYGRPLPLRPARAEAADASEGPSSIESGSPGRRAAVDDTRMEPHLGALAPGFRCSPRARVPWRRNGLDGVIRDISSCAGCAAPGARRSWRCRGRRPPPARPGGICRTDRIASRPPIADRRLDSGTPMTGRSVWAAATPGSAADRPAPGDDHAQAAHARVAAVLGDELRLAVGGHHAHLVVHVGVAQHAGGAVHDVHVALGAHDDPDARGVDLDLRRARRRPRSRVTGSACSLMRSSSPRRAGRCRHVAGALRSRFSARQHRRRRARPRAWRRAP